MTFELLVIVFLICWNVGLTVWIMILLERDHQRKGYIERMEQSWFTFYDH